MSYERELGREAQTTDVAKTTATSAPGRQVLAESHDGATHGRVPRNGSSLPWRTGSLLSNDAGADQGDQRGTLPTLRVSVQPHAQRVHNKTDAVRGLGADASHQVHHAARKAIDHVQRTRVRARGTQVGAKAGAVAEKTRDQARGHEQHANDSTHAAHGAHARDDAGHDHDDTHAVVADAGGEAGPIQLKQITSWDKFLPRDLASREERSHVLAHIQADVTSKREQTSTLLNKLRVAHVSTAGSLRAQLPAVASRIRAGQVAAISSINAAERSQTAAVWTHINGLQAQVRAASTAAIAQVNAGHTIALLGFVNAQRAALQKLAEANTSSLAGVDHAETAQLGTVAQQFADTRASVTEVAASKAGAARARGDAHQFAYEGDQLGAARDAARAVANAWADQMPTEGAKAADQIAAEQPNCENDIRTIARDQRKLINDSLAESRQTIETAMAQAAQAANQVRMQAITQIQSTASTAIAQLTANGTTKVASIRQAASLARANVGGAAKEASRAAAKLIANAARGMEKGASKLVHAAHQIEAPDPHLTSREVAAAIAKLSSTAQQITLAMQQSASQAGTGMSAQAQGAASSIDALAAAAKQLATSMGTGALAATTQATAGTVQGIGQLSTGFKTMSGGIATDGSTAMTSMVSTLREAFAQSTVSLGHALAGSVDSVSKSFDRAIEIEEGKQIQEKGDEAAANVKPWWQQALAMIVSVVVSIVVVIVVMAVIATTGPIGMLLVGAAAGALGSVLGAMASNLVLGNDIMEGVGIETAIIGAVGGALGAGFSSVISAGVNRFGSAGLQAALHGAGGIEGWAVRTGIDVANGMATDAIIQYATTGTYELDMANLASSLVMSSISSTARYSQGQSGLMDAIRAKTGYIQLGEVGGGPLSLRPSLHKPEWATPDVHVTAPDVHAPAQPEVALGDHPIASTGGEHAPTGTTHAPGAETATPALTGAGGAETARVGEASSTPTRTARTPEPGVDAQVAKPSEPGHVPASGDSPTLDLMAQKSGLSQDVLSSMAAAGDPRLARFSEVMTNLADAKAHLADLEAKSWSTPEQLDQARAAVRTAASDIPFQTELLQGAAKQHLAKVDWQNRLSQGDIDFDRVAVQGAEQIGDMYAKASGGMDAAARSLVDYRVGDVRSLYPGATSPLGNSDFNFDGRTMGSGEPLSRVARALGLLADADDGAKLGAARYNHLTELQARGIRIVVEDPTFSKQWTSRSPLEAGSQTRFAYYFQDGELHIRNARLDGTSNTLNIPSNAVIVTEDIPLSTAEGTRAYLDLVRTILAKPVVPMTAITASIDAHQSPLHDGPIVAKPIETLHPGGLADPAARAVVDSRMERLQRDWPYLTSTERAAKLGEIINDSLASQGISPVTVEHYDLTNLGEDGYFRAKDWKIALNTAKLSSTADLSKLADTIVHEARHVEQWYLIARYIAEANPSVPDAQLIDTLGIPAEVFAKARTETTPLTSDQRAAAKVYVTEKFSGVRIERADMMNGMKESFTELNAAKEELHSILEKGSATEAQIVAARQRVEAAQTNYDEHYTYYQNGALESDAWATETSPTLDPVSKWRQLLDRVLRGKPVLGDVERLDRAIEQATKRLGWSDSAKDAAILRALLAERERLRITEHR
jgi:hypothetical protein